MSTSSIITWIDGKQYTVAPYTPPVITPPAGPKLVVPATAKTSGFLDNVSNWKAEKDAGTPGTVTSSFDKFISTIMGRQFQSVYTAKAGFRWSNPFAKADVLNACYDLYVQSPDWTQVGQLELDINMMMANGMNAYMCVQADSNSGTWEFTLTPGGACHWSPSTLKTNPKTWTPNVWHHIRIRTTRDENGIVTYNGVEFDEVYQLFEATATGLSAIKEDWTAQGLINNFQVNGANASGTANVYAKEIQIFYW